MTGVTRGATNQPEALIGHHVVGSDTALVESVRRFGADDTVGSLDELGDLAGTAEAREHGRLANTFTPELVTHDRYGNRVDEVRFHPSWHWLLDKAIRFGLAATPWAQDQSSWCSLRPRAA